MKYVLIVAALFIVSPFLSRSFGQGSLTPPGPPAPTMKTLDQVEARTPIDATHTPGDPTNVFIIAASGSYYLTGNVNANKPNGIHITAAGVTVDLNGFQLKGIPGNGNGIVLDTAANNCTIKNGSITDFFGPGIGPGVSAPSRGGIISHVIASNCFGGLVVGDAWQIDHCNVHDNTSAGIRTGTGCTVSHCTALNNAGSGFQIGDGSTIVDCSASGNQGLAGIGTGEGCTITHCTAKNNTSALSSSAGISAGVGSTITACVAEGNGSTNTTPTGATGTGIRVDGFSNVQNCTASVNKGDGIRAGNNCIITANLCANNGSSGGSGDGAGVHVLNNGNRIEGNNVIGNVRGIDVDFVANLIIKNSAGGNVTNYDIAPNNVFGAIVDRTGPASAAVAGNSAASSAGTTDPWANISY